jgi:hypothetical protein
MINLAVVLNLRTDPKAFGFCIFVTKRLFHRAGGFDETLYVAEDNAFVKRASMYRGLRFLSSAYIMVSIRRFEKEGRFTYMKKGIKLNLYRTFRGEIYNDEVVKYEFDNFDEPETKEDKDFLDWLEKRMIKIEKNSRNFNKKIMKQTNDAVYREIHPKLEEFSHLIEDLDIYFAKNERRIQRILKWKSFFKPRKKRK